MRQKHAPALYAAHVQNVVDDGDQIFARFLCLDETVAHNLAVVHGLERQFVHPHDRVERRANVVGHLVKKIALGFGPSRFQLDLLVFPLLEGKIV